MKFLTTPPRLCSSVWTISYYFAKNMVSRVFIITCTPSSRQLGRIDPPRGYVHVDVYVGLQWNVQYSRQSRRVSPLVGHGKVIMHFTDRLGYNDYLPRD